MLAAQTQFFEQLTNVRKEMSADVKETRAEIISVLKEAHVENVKRLDTLAQSLTAHEDKDDERFLTVHRWMWICIGGAAVLGIVGNVALALWK